LAKVLLIRFSSIGDIILTTPVVRTLYQQMHGGAEIHYLTKKRFAPLLEPNPYLSRVITIEKSTNEVVDQLKEEQYHYVVDLHMNLRSFRVKRALSILSFGFKKLNFEKWLLVNFGVNRLPEVHIVDRYLEAVKAFGIKNDGKGLDYFFPEGGDELPTDIPAGHRKEYVALAIGAAHWRKKPRRAQFLEICERIDFPVILLGGPAEAEEGEAIAARMGSKVWNAAGKVSLHGSAALIKHSRLVVTPDTGMMPIAAAFKKPIFSIWGATVPAFGMYPYLNENLDVRIEADHLSRRPCSKLGTRCKYKACRCIDELPLGRLVEAVNSQRKVPSTR
jgi:heptosyltransferase-2